MLLVRGLAIVSLLLLTASASAEPPNNTNPDSPLGKWYKSLRYQNESGVSIPCCSISDCRPVEARHIANHWEILLEKRWRQVPQSRVLKQYNMDGRPIACIGNAFGDAFYTDIRCFVPPPES